MQRKIHPSSRPEMALAELDRAYRALENWGVTQAPRPASVRTLRSLDLREISELYVAGLQLFENREHWSAEHLARAVQHLAQAGWYESRLLWRRGPWPTSGSSGKPHLLQLPRPHPPSVDQIREIQDQHQNTENLIQSLQTFEAEMVRSGSLSWPELVPRLLRETRRHWERTTPPSPELLQRSLGLEELRETLGLIQELVEGIFCLRLAWLATSEKPPSARETQSA